MKEKFVFWSRCSFSDCSQFPFGEVAASFDEARVNIENHEKKHHGGKQVGSYGLGVNFPRK